MPLPNALIVGTPKCGTTSLFRWLEAHPDACGPREKELWYLKDMSWRERHRIDFDPFFSETFRPRPFDEDFVRRYAELFAACGRGSHKVIFEATPDYIYHRTALEFLSTLSPPPLLIFSFRRPSARIYSYYQFAKNNLGGFDRDLGFARFLDIIRERLPNRLGSQIHLLIKQSCYVDYLAVWFERLPRDRVAVYLFEDIVRDPRGTMQDLARRLDIDPAFYESYDFPRENPSYQVRSVGLHRTLLKVRTKLPPWLRDGILRALYRALNTAPAQGESSPEDRTLLAELDDYFRPCNRRLAELTGLDLSAWES